MIELKKISKIYDMGDVKVTALNDVSFTCEKGITIIVVKHEEDIAAYTRRTIYLRDSSIIEDKQR